MAMLSEPRRKKQRIGLNPRGKFFTEDEDNRGRTILQKMGWNKGDGLGVERQGIREPIRPKIQNDAKGLGFDVKSDPWVAHNDDFNAILKNLQASHTSSSREEPVKQTDRKEDCEIAGFGFKLKESNTEKVEHIDLEKNSKSSRSRIHYHKVIRNKDLSKINQKDWSCIFGKSMNESIPNKEQAETLIETDKQQVAYVNKFTNRGSMQDYFKAQRARTFVKSQELLKDLNNTNSKEDEKIESPSTIESDKKKAKKNKITTEEEDEKYVECPTIEIETKKKKKSKKNKIATDEKDEKYLESPTTIEIESKKNKKSKKNKIATDEDEKYLESPTIKSKKKKKPKPKKNKITTEEYDNTEKKDSSVISEKSVSESVLNEDPVKTFLEPEEEQEKSCRKGLEDNNNSNNQDKEYVECPTIENKKKKKSKKNKIMAEESENTQKIENDQKDSSVISEISVSESVRNEDQVKTFIEPEEEQEKSARKGLEDNTTSSKDEEYVESPTIDSKDEKKSTIKKSKITAEEYYDTALTFTGSNLLQIPGYRNQSNKLL